MRDEIEVDIADVAEKRVFSDGAGEIRWEAIFEMTGTCFTSQTGGRRRFMPPRHRFLSEKREEEEEDLAFGRGAEADAPI